MIHNSSIGLINILWTLSIIFLSLGILFFITSFVYARLNSLHPIINIASFLSGALILIFSIPFFTTIKHDVQFGVWYASYDILVTIIIVPLLLFVIIVLVLPIIHHPDHRWPGVRCDLYEVEFELACQPPCLFDRLDADLPTVRIDEANLFDPDLLIDSGLFDRSLSRSLRSDYDEELRETGSTRASAAW